MKLSKKAIEAITADRNIILHLAIQHNTNEDTMRRWLGKNEDNGYLTTLVSLRLIKEKTGLEDKQILTEE